MEKLDKLQELTGRQKDVMELIVLGFDNQEIADKLHISQVTVKSHYEEIYSKLYITGECRRTKLTALYWKRKFALFSAGQNKACLI